MRRFYIIAGCNGAGKTTASYTTLSQIFECDEYVNADEIAKFLSPANPETSAVRASRIMLDRLDELFSKGISCCVESTLATRTLARTLIKANKLGYETTLVYYWLRDPQIAVERVKKRVESGGHFIAESTIRRRYELGLEHLFQLYLPICDHWFLINNSKVPGKIIAEGGLKHDLAIYDTNDYNQMIQYGQPSESVQGD